MSQRRTGRHTPDTPLAVRPGVYRLDPARTTITATVRALFGLFAVKGSFTLLDGEIRVATDLKRSSVTARAAAKSFASGNATRDRDVLSAALLDVDAFPDITFSADSASEGADGWIVVGTIGAHGATTTVDLHVTEITVDPNVARVRARGSLDRALLGVTGKRGLVGRTVSIVVDATAVRV